MQSAEVPRQRIARAGSRIAVGRAAVTAVVVLTLSVSVPMHCTATDLVTAPSAVENVEPPAATATEVSNFDAARLEVRMRAATEIGALNGARVSIAFMDRVSGSRATNGNEEPIETASVSKLFIADDLLFRDDRGEVDLSGSDMAQIDAMLRSSDDSAAEQLWNRFGRNDIVERVAARYGLPFTSVRPGDEWWRTRTTMNDVVTFYSALIDDAGGLSPSRSVAILSNLENFTRLGADGYYQRFGLPDALPDESELGVKQGWMCCLGSDWIHLSTGFVGPDHRYVVAIASRESANTFGGGSVGADHARRTMTATASALFPSGRIDLR
ncbi:serine hydrolase [Rhodococcus sp. 15-649-2-2]|uniref:serine hydrolase n=1 Tax=Rhodococcus sp. 15-649-2-2 TaxID=2023140 RepID=UPI00117BAC02|nr:serine hydrolase [Rhodococcus sp. 15-649-2-2]